MGSGAGTAVFHGAADRPREGAVKADLAEEVAVGRRSAVKDKRSSSASSASNSSNDAGSSPGRAQSGRTVSDVGAVNSLRVNKAGSDNNGSECEGDAAERVVAVGVIDAAAEPALDADDDDVGTDVACNAARWAAEG
jgi:hypothetical protein